MIDKKYYKKLGGFSYLLDEIRKRIGEEQTEFLLDNAVTLCNEFCKQYKDKKRYILNE